MFTVRIGGCSLRSVQCHRHRVGLLPSVLPRRAVGIKLIGIVVTSVYGTGNLGSIDMFVGIVVTSVYGAVRISWLPSPLVFGSAGEDEDNTISGLRFCLPNALIRALSSFKQ